MQTLLDDIELDIQNLKCLMQVISNDANPTLRIVAKRNIQQMRTRLDALQTLLDEALVSEPSTTGTIELVQEVELVQKQLVETVQEQSAIDVVKPVQPAVNQFSSILAERIKPAANLRHAISLNDSFRFTRELFNGDTTRMNEVVHCLGEAPSLDKAMDIFNLEVHPDEENEAAVDFVELLKKHFS